jgi:hypothetical protein
MPDEKKRAAEGYRYETDEEHEAYLTKLTRRKRRNATILFVTLAIIFTALAIYLVNRYDSTIFNMEAPKPKPDNIVAAIPAKADTTTVKDTTKKVIPADTSSIKGNTPAKDSLAKVIAPAADTIGYPRWELVGGSFKKAAEAYTAIRNYSTLGIKAHLADMPGPWHHVSLGTYKTRDEASKAIKVLLKNKKIKRDIYPLEIKPKL